MGSNSFSGSHFVALLLQQGYEVLGISRSVEIAPPFRPYEQQKPDTWRFAQVDLNDHVSIHATLRDFAPELVINFAAQSMVGQSWITPQDWYETNVVAIAHLGQSLQRLNTLRRYVHVTTPEVYGSTQDWIPESDVFHPTTPYAISRAAGDQHLMALQASTGLPIVFTRAANVYGAGQQLFRIIPRALLSARLARKLPLDGGGHSIRSFIHISDVARATLDIAESGTDGLTYHISTNELVSIRQLVEKVAELTGVPFAELVVEAGERVGKDAAYQLDSSRLRSSFDWTPQISLDDGLRSTLAWVDENLDLLSSLPVDYVHKR